MGSDENVSLLKRREISSSIAKLMHAHQISASKIEPLESGQKHGVEHELNSDGVIGNDKTIDQTRIDPVGGAGKSMLASIPRVSPLSMSH